MLHDDDTRAVLTQDLFRVYQRPRQTSPKESQDQEGDVGPIVDLVGSGVKVLSEWDLKLNLSHRAAWTEI